VKGEPIDPDELTLEEGVFLTRLARRAVEEKLLNGNIITPPPNTPSKLLRPGMTFTTIESITPTGGTTLRGCIGFLMPVYSLVESTIKSALEAAFNDPRFPPLSRDEIDHVVFEVSVLSLPQQLPPDKRREYPGMIKISRNGLIVERGWQVGTLLPVVPVEYCWDEETFLAETCLKAGMPPDCWLDEHTSVKTYYGRVFREAEPHGRIYERDMVSEYRSRCLKN
jgi:AmmeMemoRadiSam system protein A